MEKYQDLAKILLISANITHVRFFNLICLENVLC